jgi:chloramphenicol-sensitive protein RarD
MHPGVLQAALAYACWGLFPLYFRLLGGIPALEVLVHRVIWSLAFVLVIIAAQRRWGWVREVIATPTMLLAFAASAVLLSINWLTYIWAVTHGHVIDASLGYFITPLVNVLLGSTVLHERLRPLQWTAVALAALGVLWLALQAGQLPWIALVLAASFGAYGLMRKTAPLGALEGLALETLLLAPARSCCCSWRRRRATATSRGERLDQPAAARRRPVTAIPLLLFAAGARRIRLTTLGLLQYLAPSIQFVLGCGCSPSPFSASRMVGFGLIWGALVLYSVEGWRRGWRRGAAAE